MARRKYVSDKAGGSKEYNMERQIMKKVLEILGIIFIFATIVLAVLYILKVSEMAYCFFALIICLILFGIRHVIK